MVSGKERAEKREGGERKNDHETLGLNGVTKREGEKKIQNKGKTISMAFVWEKGEEGKGGKKREKEKLSEGKRRKKERMVRKAGARWEKEAGREKKKRKEKKKGKEKGVRQGKGGEGG